MRNDDGRFSDQRYCSLLTAWARGSLANGTLASGTFELHEVLCDYAETSEKIIEFLRDNKTNFDFPGVYDYDVSEPFGQWFGDYLLRHDAAPQIEEANEKLFELVSTFFILSEEEKQRLNVFIKGLK